MSKTAMKLALEALKVATTPLARDRQEVLRAITALREALAEQKSGIKQVIELYDSPDQPAQQEQNRQIDQLIQERDHRDEIIDKLCDAVLGPDRYEWSSQYFFEDAVREVEERMAEQPAQRTWVGLTAEERNTICANAGTWREAMKVIEAKLKEKNT